MPRNAKKCQGITGPFYAVRYYRRSACHFARTHGAIIGHMQDARGVEGKPQYTSGHAPHGRVINGSEQHGVIYRPRHWPRRCKETRSSKSWPPPASRNPSAMDVTRAPWAHRCIVVEADSPMDAHGHPWPSLLGATAHYRVGVGLADDAVPIRDVLVVFAPKYFVMILSAPGSSDPAPQLSQTLTATVARQWTWPPSLHWRNDMSSKCLTSCPLPQESQRIDCFPAYILLFLERCVRLRSLLEPPKNVCEPYHAWDYSFDWWFGLLFHKSQAG